MQVFKVDSKAEFGQLNLAHVDSCNIQLGLNLPSCSMLNSGSKIDPVARPGFRSLGSKN